MAFYKRIEFISSEEFSLLIDKLENHSFKKDEERNFILVADGIYHGIDNTSGQLWQEEFETLEEAIDYCIGDINESVIYHTGEYA